jgi:hypothetical protein
MVVVVNVAMMPSIAHKLSQHDADILSPIFKRIHFIISACALCTFITGGLVVWMRVKFDILSLLGCTQGKLIFIGGTLGFMITLFHFLIEDNVIDYLKSKSSSKNEIQIGYKGIEYIPKIGLIMISTIFILMLIAARGF